MTLPLELEMNGVPRMVVMRSVSLYGLSDMILTFDDNTDDYFARQIVFERLARATLPTGITPSIAPLFSPSGLVYRYVLKAQTAAPQELKTIEDWVLGRAYRSVHGVADDSGFGGTIMQYQVLLDPARIYGYHLTVPQVTAALSANNANAGGGFYSQGGQFYYVRGIGLCAIPMTLEILSWEQIKACPFGFATLAKSALDTRRVSVNLASRKMMTL